MGWNTVAVIMNDATGDIAADAGFGSRLAKAMRIMGNGKRVDVAAHGERSIHCNAATIVSHDHADGHQIVVAHGNTGYRITGDPSDGVPDEVVRYVETILKRRKQAAKK